VARSGAPARPASAPMAASRCRSANWAPTSRSLTSSDQRCPSGPCVCGLLSHWCRAEPERSLAWVVRSSANSLALRSTTDNNKDSPGSSSRTRRSMLRQLASSRMNAGCCSSRRISAARVLSTAAINRACSLPMSGSTCGATNVRNHASRLASVGLTCAATAPAAPAGLRPSRRSRSPVACASGAGLTEESGAFGLPPSESAASRKRFGSERSARFWRNAAKPAMRANNWSGWKSSSDANFSVTGALAKSNSSSTPMALNTVSKLSRSNFSGLRCAGGRMARALALTPRSATTSIQKGSSSSTLRAFCGRPAVKLNCMGMLAMVFLCIK
jgi:hypothetical protein